MGKEADLKNRLLHSVVMYVRENHAEVIDKAYAYFWDDTYPDEFLSGTPLEMGFINFEDWLACDYRVNREKETFIDLYIKNCDGLKGEELNLLRKIRDSVLSLYEVLSVSRDKRVVLRDLLLDGEFDVRNKVLSRGLKKGDIFAARLLALDKKTVLSGAVYPFSREQKKAVLESVEKQFKRYRKNVKHDGTMKDYLKDYGDVFNIIWLKFILEPMEKMRSEARSRR